MKHPTLEEINQNLKKFAAPNTYKKQYTEFYNYILKTYPFAKKFTEGLWCFYRGISEPPKCPVCGKQVPFKCWSKGYNEFCSVLCMQRGTRDRAVKTMERLYGGIGMASEETKKKIVEKTIKRYGGIGMASEETKSKIQKTNLEKYGDIFPSKTKEVKEKSEKTMLERYGVTRALQHPDFLKKSQDTLESHYGVRTPMENLEIREKCTKHSLQSRIGFQDPNHPIRAKINKTNQERYGRDWGFDYDKIKQTNLERYGVENPMIDKCSRGEIKYHGYSKISQECFRKFDEYLTDYHTQYAEKGGEKMIQTKDHKYDVDYYIEELKIAIEFNGDVYHGNPQKYKPGDHCIPFNESITAKDLWRRDAQKYNEIEEVGIKVIPLWESDYLKLKDIKKWIVKNLQITL